MSNPAPQIRPPYVGESALHYCETIAYTHRWQSVNQLLAACGEKPIVNWNNSQPKKIEAALVAVTKPFEFKQPINLKLLLPPRGSQKKIKVCLQCIKDKHPHLVTHQMPINTHCDIHKTQLLDKCTSCGAQIKSSIHSHCSACDAPLLNVSNVQNYVLFSAQLGVEKERFLISLLQLAEHFIRPLDIFNEPPNWDTLDNAQITHLMNFAYQFLITDYAILQYKSTLYAKHSEYLHMSIGILNKKVNDIGRAANQCWQTVATSLPSRLNPTLFDDSDFKKTSEVVSKKRALIASDAHEPLETHCSATQLAKLFGTDTQDMFKLVREGIVKPLISANRVANMVFGIKTSIGHINKRMSKVPERKRREYVSLLKIADKTLGAYGVDKTDIIFAVLRGEIPAYFDAFDKNNGGQFKVNVDALLDYLKWNNTIDNHISIKAFAKRLLVPEAVIIELVKECDELYYAKYKKVGQNLIDQAAAEAFLLNYICLNREAWLYGIPPHEVKAKLGIDSCSAESTLVFEIVDSNREYVFYKTDEYITRSLNLIFDDIPFRVFTHKYGRQQFPSIEQSIKLIELKSQESEHAI
jgi:hypothetical protein